MQLSSKAYSVSMNKPIRNRGYIKVSIGVVNSDAQRNVSADYDRNSFMKYSDLTKPFDGYSVSKIYATSENDFSKLDGSRYFVPQDGQTYFNNGLVTSELLGSIYIAFNGLYGLDIKGLTIDFGDCYPVDFTIENESNKRFYEGNNQRVFVTEDVFDGTSYLLITPRKMVNGQGRLRIYQFSCGVVNVFTNNETINFSMKEYVSPITETLPSMDMSLTVDNQDQYFSPDNPESTLAYFEVGQEMKVSFGYDVLGDGNIEWMPENTAYLKDWSATDTQATFSATDRFERLTGKYYKGLYRPKGITLYDLALDVLTDAGILDEREYYIDPYLKDVVVYNPIPPVTHAEALQIIANAGRCVLFEDRLSRIHIKASFVPDMSASTNDQTEYSDVSNVLNDSKKDGYATSSNGFSLLDGSLSFKDDKNFLNIGYVSNSVWVVPPENSLLNRLSFRLGTENKHLSNGGFWDGITPKINITLEAGFVPYGLLIKFRNVAPEEFIIRTYYQGTLVIENKYRNPELEFYISERFELLDQMEIEFTKGAPNSRIFVDSILIGDVTNYTLSRNNALTSSPTARRQNKVRSIDVYRTIFRKDLSELREVISEEINLNSGSTKYTVYFTNPTTDASVSVLENTSVSAEIVDSSDYFATILFSGISSDNTLIKFVVNGHEYIQNEQLYSKKYNDIGDVKEWTNPLVSSYQHAVDLEQWLSTHLLGDVDYNINWRGDPRTDANDLFYLELKDREQTLIRCYQNEIKFNGTWNGTMKARRAVVSWQ